MMIAEVKIEETYYDMDSNHGYNDETKPKKKRPPNHTWLKINEFNSAQEAETHINSQNLWKKSSSKSTLDGQKVEYRCSKGKYRINECPAKIYLLYHSTNTKVSLFATDCIHANHNLETSNRGLDSETKQFVKTIFSQGVEKPNAILALLSQKQTNLPPKSKLIAFLTQLRCKKVSAPVIFRKDLIKWLQGKELIPDSKDLPFVLKQFVSNEFETQNQDLKMVLTTKRLLENLTKSDLIQIDSSYRLLWHGYPLIIIGTSDKNCVFHPLAIAITKDENSNDYNFIFKALQSYNENWSPKYLLSNNNQLITQGFEETFGQKINLTCFSSMQKEIEYNLKTFPQNQTLKSDISFLQLSPDEKTFQIASKLFYEKWIDESKDFIDYFIPNWIQNNQNWFEGKVLGFPSSNKAIETFVANIKKDHILREKLPVEQFFNNVLELLMKWSKERDPLTSNCKEFSEVMEISSQIWNQAYQWAMQNITVLQDNNLFYTSSESITLEQLTNYKEMQEKWITFDDFKTYNSNIFTVNINSSDLNDYSCTCPQFLKQIICIHVLGMKIKLQLIEVPCEVVLKASGEKRKRGRPSKSTKALII